MKSNSIKSERKVKVSNEMPSRSAKPSNRGSNRTSTSKPGAKKARAKTSSTRTKESNVGREKSKQSSRKKVRTSWVGMVRKRVEMFGRNLLKRISL